MSFQFDKVPWPDVLRQFADATGLILRMDAFPSGVLTHQAPGLFTEQEALQQLNQLLRRQEIVLIRRGDELFSLSADAAGEEQSARPSAARADNRQR